MHKFVMGISDHVVNDCGSSVLIPIMYMSRLMIKQKQIEEEKLKQGGIELNRSMPDEGYFSKARFEVQDRTRLKIGLLIQVHPMF